MVAIDATVQLKVFKFVFIVFKVDRFVLLSSFKAFIASTTLFQLSAVRVSHLLTVSNFGKLKVA
jgi:hypothetical protein